MRVEAYKYATIQPLLAYDGESDTISKVICWNNEDPTACDITDPRMTSIGIHIGNTMSKLTPKHSYRYKIDSISTKGHANINHYVKDYILQYSPAQGDNDPEGVIGSTGWRWIDYFNPDSECISQGGIFPTLTGIYSRAWCKNMWKNESDGCESRPGGSYYCCPQTIINNGRYCDVNNEIQGTPPCQMGVFYGNIDSDIEQNNKLKPMIYAKWLKIIAVDDNYVGSRIMKLNFMDKKYYMKH